MANQQTRVVIALRDMILNGELPPDEALAEVALSERFGVSRTPVRHALTVLEHEGLLTRADSRSYVVRRFRASEIADAIEVRGVLEGLAVRLIAEHGVPRGLARALRDCLAEGDRIIDAADFAPDGRVRQEARAQYFDMNARFHRAIVAESGNTALQSAIELNDKTPFASAESVAFHAASRNDEPRRYLFAHMQHHLIVEALEAGESARAEALMREHAQVGKRNMNLSPDEADALEAIGVPGVWRLAVNP